jgi:hypothetical protein
MYPIGSCQGFHWQRKVKESKPRPSDMNTCPPVAVSVHPYAAQRNPPMQKEKGLLRNPFPLVSHFVSTNCKTKGHERRRAGDTSTHAEMERKLAWNGVTLVLGHLPLSFGPHYLIVAVYFSCGYAIRKLRFVLANHPHQRRFMTNGKPPGLP